MKNTKVLSGIAICTIAVFLVTALPSPFPSAFALYHNQNHFIYAYPFNS
jgi:hypothetical protein